MKKLPSLFLLFVSGWCVGQDTLIKKLIFKINSELNDQAVTILWHPEQKKYYGFYLGYTTVTGIEVSPFTMFDANGILLIDTNLTTLIGSRSIWYNEKTKTLQFYEYNSREWSEYLLDPNGIPIDKTTLIKDAGHPNTELAGAYDFKRNVAVFYNKFEIEAEFYNILTAHHDTSVFIYHGCMDKKDTYQYIDKTGYYDWTDILDKYSVRIIYTGILGAELGLLNIYEERIELYNSATGYLTKTLHLPKDAATAGFSFTNNIYWLFDEKKRTWIGYQ